MVRARKRRHHHRSRNGCISCKQRHMRCDEGRPFCLNCLRSGANCGYRDGDSSNLRRLDENVYENMPQTFSSVVLGDVEEALSMSDLSCTSMTASFVTTPPLTLLDPLGAEAADPFDTLPIDISYGSRLLMDHFINYRILIREPMLRPRNSGDGLFELAKSDAALMHSSLMLSANHLISVGCTRTLVESTLYQHKTTVIRMVNERLGDLATATCDGTVGAVANLTILESLNGSVDTSQKHLNGLEQLIRIRGDLHSGRMKGILQRMVLLADIFCSTASHTQPRFQAHPNDGYAELPESPQPSALLEVIDEDEYVPNSVFIEEVVGLDPEMVKMFSDLHWLSYLVALHDKGTLVMRSSKLNQSISECENFVDNVTRAGRHRDRSVKGVSTQSGCCVTAGYIYVYLFLRRIPNSSSIFSYMLTLMKQEWKRAGTFIREIFPPDLLLWVLFVGRCASSKQLEPWFKVELVLSKNVLNLKSWMEARGVLERFAWVSGWHEETYVDFWDELVEFEATQNG